MNPQRNAPRPQQQLSAEQVQKQREFLIQQQKLRLMASTNTQKAVSADTLIENLLSKKETFKLSDPLPSSTFPSTSSEKVVETRKFPQAQYDPRQQTNQQVAVEWLSPKSPNFPELYRKVFSMVGEPDGMVDTGKIFPLLLTSGLSTDVLGYIWGLVNRCVAGKLTESELYAVLALVALAQKGYSFNSASVLSLVPQAPIPNLNLGADPQLPVKTRREDLNLQSFPSSVSPSHQSMAPSLVPESNTSYNQPAAPPAHVPIFGSQPPTVSTDVDDFDDFTDFQSASASIPSATPTPKLSSSSQKSEPMTPHKPLPSAEPSSSSKLRPSAEPPKQDPLSFPEPVFVQKFPVAIVGGRTIGSRLANHSLGAAKHSLGGTKHSLGGTKHPASAAKQSSTVPGAAKATKPRHKSHQHRASPPRPTNPLDDDFSDFQQAVTVDVFSRCSPSQGLVLKESAIRKEVAASPIHAASGSEPAQLVAPDESEDVFKSLPIPEKANELMGVEEDRYGALRALSLFEVEPSLATKDDGFGDFISTETAVVDDSFAVIATRPAAAAAEADVGWSLPQTEAPLPVQFDVDDWGTFESASEPSTNIDSASESKGAANFDFSGDWQTGASTVDNLSSQISNLDLSAIISSMKPLEVESTPSFAGGLLDPLDISLQPSNSKTNSDSRSCQVNDEDDFGEFVSPNTWTGGKNADMNLDSLSWQEEGKEVDTQPPNILWLDDSKAATEHPWPDEKKTELGRAGKEKVLENPLVSSLWLEDTKGLDNQSVSSLELPGLEHAWDAVGEWRRCLQSCLVILQFAVDTFDALTDSLVLTEVLNSAQAQSYLKDLVEVWYICERIATSYHKTGLDQKIDALLNSTTTMWSLLKPHFNQAKIVVESDMCTEGADMCSVCLADGASVAFEGHSYHAPCANLWLNNIDTVLPALHQP